jgi:NAD dependent epimerase/dehydratase family enzyme
MEKIDDTLRQMEQSLARAARENRKPKEEILSDMQKVRFGQEIGPQDVDVVVNQTELSIARIRFTLNSIRSVINGS